MLALNLPLVLASRSPRRSELLRRLDIVFEVRPSDVHEVVTGAMSPPEMVEHLALLKAQHVVADAPTGLILGADTVVVLERRVLGKPRDEIDAERMLRALSGRTHSVYSGIALVHPASGRSATASERTFVTFGNLTDDEIESYVATGSPLDKAGAYGIQDDLGALLIERIDGDYYNVVGLPLRRLYRLLRDEFGDLLQTGIG